MTEKKLPENKPYEIKQIEGKKHAIWFKDEKLGIGLFDENIALAMEKALNDAYCRGFSDGIK